MEETEGNNQSLSGESWVLSDTQLEEKMTQMHAEMYIQDMSTHNNVFKWNFRLQVNMSKLVANSFFFK